MSDRVDRHRTALTTTSPHPSVATAAAAAALDAASIVLFVAVGRRNHDEDPGIGGTMTTAAPFLVAAVVAWLLPAVHRAPTAARAGITTWLVTAVGGLALRRLVFDRGIALPFVIVAAVALGLLLVGWRVVARYLRH